MRTALLTGLIPVKGRIDLWVFIGQSVHGASLELNPVARNKRHSMAKEKPPPGNWRGPDQRTGSLALTAGRP